MPYNEWVGFATNVLAISSAAVLGVLTRINIDSLFGPFGASITSRDSLLFYDLPANTVGCFVLGTFNALKNRIAIHPLIVLAVSTGYAGSLTSMYDPSFPTIRFGPAFASWMYQVVRMLVRGDWLPSLFAVASGILLPYCALFIGRDFVDFGSHLYFWLSRQPQNSEDRDASLPLAPVSERQKDEYSLLTIVFTFCAFIAVFPATVVGAILHRDNQRLRMQWTSGALAPAGATARWVLSQLNGRTPGFPKGTFIANSGAILLDVSIGAALLLQPANSTAIFVLNALITGLAGSLSTVSTWINESASMNRSQRYIYLASTVTTAILIGIAVYGSVYWVVQTGPR